MCSANTVEDMNSNGFQEGSADERDSLIRDISVSWKLSHFLRGGTKEWFKTQ